MEVVCRCSACETQFKVDERYSGRKAKCPKCATVVMVPGSPRDSSSSVVLNPSVAAALQGAPKPAAPAAAPAPAPSAAARAPETAAPAPSRASSSSSAIDIKPLQKAAPLRQEGPASVSINAAAPASARAPAPAAAPAPSTAAPATEQGQPAFTISTTPAVHTGPAASPAVSHKPKKKSGIPAIVPIIGGGVLAVLIVGGVFGAWQLLKGLQGKSSSSGKPVLIVDLSASERKDASISINGKKRNIPASGEVKFELAPGSHKVTLQRRGYEPIDVTLSLKAGDRHPYKPDWKANSVAGIGGFNPAASSGGAGASFNPADSSGIKGYPGWLQNLEVAKRRAGEGKKDLLLVFVGSDWSAACQSLQSEVFLTPDFRQLAETKFIPVVIDLPQDEAGFNMLEDRAQNSRLRQQFHVSPQDLPAVVLADVQGRPYAMHETYRSGGGSTYLEKLKKSLDDKAERDRILGLPKTATGEARLAAAKEAAAWLQEKKLSGHFGPEVRTWMQIAKEHDPNNEQGSHEVIFEADWLCRLNELAESMSIDRIRQLVGELTQWQQTRKFRDGNRGARLHLISAMLLARLEDNEGASRQLELGLACNPTDDKIRKGLEAGSSAVASAGQLSSGTGFVVHPDGYILTNHHVVEGKGKVVVRLSDDKKDTLPATIIAKEAKRDMAILKISPANGVKLSPVVVSAAEVRRGAKVAAFGFPLGDAIGAGLKLTQGVVGAPPNSQNEGMLLLDMRVNPGNSGGPLCNARGHVIGMVTAKTRSTEQADSYGLARPALDLHDYLKKHVPNYVPPVDDGNKESLEWDEVDKRVSQSVVMILMMER